MGTGLELRTSERITSTLNYSVIYPGPVLCLVLSKGLERIISLSYKSGIESVLESLR